MDDPYAARLYAGVALDRLVEAYNQRLFDNFSTSVWKLPTLYTQWLGVRATKLRANRWMKLGIGLMGITMIVLKILVGIRVKELLACSDV
jgi:hypothetical protein